MDSFNVTVVFADQHQQTTISLLVMPGWTLEQAVNQSGLLSHFPTLEISKNKVGIWGKIVPLHTVLQPNDRIEIYSALLIDPKQARRKRASRLKKI